MRLLVLGGGVFLGAAVVDAACAAGHAVTVFNRGRARRAWPAGVECIVGDRQRDLGALQGRRFDAVVNTCGYLPGDVCLSAEALSDAGQYLFVSSVSAYASLVRPGEDERAPLASFDGVAPDDRSVAHYGAQKAACEAALRTAWGERARQRALPAGRRRAPVDRVAAVDPGERGGFAGLPRSQRGTGASGRVEHAAVAPDGRRHPGRADPRARRFAARWQADAAARTGFAGTMGAGLRYLRLNGGLAGAGRTQGIRSA